MTTKSISIAALTTAALAFGTGYAVAGTGDGTPTPTPTPTPTRAAATQSGQHGSGMGQGMGMRQGMGQGQGMHQGQGKGMGQGKGHRKGKGKGQGKRHGQGKGAGGHQMSTSTAPLTLSATERADLLFLREEEKLAGDVYEVLGKRYPDRTFTNIGASEDRHTAAVQNLLDRAGIADPTAGNAVGEFENDELQALYDRLIKQGSASRVAALKVGAVIEETDIEDLRERTANTDDAAIRQVLASLERGSVNHLNAFVSGLDRLGVTYEPIVLSAEEYAAVLEG